MPQNKSPYLPNPKSPFHRITLALVITLTLPGTALAEPRAGWSWDKGYLLQTGLSLAAIPLTDNDRLQHVAAGSAISAYVTHRTGSFWKGCGAALAAGILKEAYDDWSDTGRFEARDIGYTIVGCSFTLRF